MLKFLLNPPWEKGIIMIDESNAAEYEAGVQVFKQFLLEKNHVARVETDVKVERVSLETFFMCITKRCDSIELLNKHLLIENEELKKKSFVNQEITKGLKQITKDLEEECASLETLLESLKESLTNLRF